jgi:hypothetical protein
MAVNVSVYRGRIRTGPIRKHAETANQPQFARVQHSRRRITSAWHIGDGLGRNTSAVSMNHHQALAVACLPQQSSRRSWIPQRHWLPWSLRPCTCTIRFKPKPDRQNKSHHVQITDVVSNFHKSLRKPVHSTSGDHTHRAACKGRFSIPVGAAPPNNQTMPAESMAPDAEYLPGG